MALLELGVLILAVLCASLTALAVRTAAVARREARARWGVIDS